MVSVGCVLFIETSLITKTSDCQCRRHYTQVSPSATFFAGKTKTIYNMIAINMYK